MKKPIIDYDLKITFSNEALLDMCREYLKGLALPCAGHFDLTKGPVYYDPSIIATFVPAEADPDAPQPSPLYADATLTLEADPDCQVRLEADPGLPAAPAPAAADASSEDDPF